MEAHDIANLAKKLKACEGNPNEQYRLIQGLHEKFWHAPTHDMNNFLKALDYYNPEIAKITKAVFDSCATCRKTRRTTHKPLVKASSSTRKLS